MLVFPSNPNPGDVFAPGPGFPTWQWDGDKWTRASAALFTLEGLADVAVTDPVRGQLLTWNDVEDKWVNGGPPAAQALGDLADVMLSTPADGNVLAWNALDGVWRNQPLSPGTLATLLDVAIAAPSAGALLTYDGTRWVSGGNAIIAAGSGTAPALTVNCQAGSGPGALVLAQPNGNGLQISGYGTSSNQYQFSVVNGNDYLCAIWGDGSGFLGPNSVINLHWNTLANFSFSAPPSGPTLTVNTRGQMAVVLQSENGYTNGVMWQQLGRTQWQALQDGGTDSWRLWNANSGTVLAAYNTGTVVINPPQPGNTALQVNGGFSPTSIASFQAIGGVNGPGLYINMQDSPSKVSLIASGYNIPGSFAIAFANGEVLNFGGGSVATFSAPYVQVPNMASTGVTGLPYVVIDGNGNLLRWGATSSLRYKTNIHSVARERARAVLSKLRAITYTSTIEGDDPERVSYGLIAEEVAKVDSRLVCYKEGKPESVIYDRVVMLLLPLMQEVLGMDEPEGEISDVSFPAKS